MGRPSIDQDVHWFLQTLRRVGGSSGNYRLQSELKWSDDRYWRTHSKVLNDGLVERAPGRGGSVRVIKDVAETRSEPAQRDVSEIISAQAAETFTRERQIYPIALGVIRANWANERSYNEFVVEITADLGRAQTGGTWTRPDITLLGLRSYLYMPGKFFEIVTFEIKTLDFVDVRGVFEALSHAQFATQAYVVFHVDATDFNSHPNAERIKVIAAQHGVGVISAPQIGDYSTWFELVEARRNQPDPEQANRFIAASFSRESRDKVTMWHR